MPTVADAWLDLRVAQFEADVRLCVVTAVDLERGSTRTGRAEDNRWPEQNQRNDEQDDELRNCHRELSQQHVADNPDDAESESGQQDASGPLRITVRTTKNRHRRSLALVEIRVRHGNDLMKLNSSLLSVNYSEGRWDR